MTKLKSSNQGSKTVVIRWSNTLLLYSASSLKRPLEVVTFLHLLYLPKLVHVAHFYFHARSTTTLNQNLCKRVLTALSQCQLILSGHFLVTSQALSFQSWRFVARSKQMTSVFWESLADQICRWANQISRVESCFLRETVMQLWRWTALTKKLCSAMQSPSKVLDGSRWKVTLSPTRVWL